MFIKNSIKLITYLLMLLHESEANRPMSEAWDDKNFDYHKNYTNFLGCYPLKSSTSWTEAKKCLCYNGKPSGFIGLGSCDLGCPASLGEKCGGSQALSLYQVCRPGRYGKYCDLPCFCWNYRPCDAETGECFYSKCRDGKKFQGKKCFDGLPIGLSREWQVKAGQPAKQSCKDGTYGIYCEEKCNCAQGGCDRVSGACLVERCFEGYFGKRCDKKNHCTQHICQNNGKCVNDYPGFRCVCDHKYWVGSRCEIENPCLKEPCENGGKCNVEDDTYDCECKDEWGGWNCEYDASIGSTDNYVACVRDGQATEEHSLSEKVLNDVSGVEPCVVKCRSKGFTFAGLQIMDNGKKECFCGDDYGRYGVVSDTQCSNLCQNQTKCGGRRAFAVYSTCPIGKFDYGCRRSCRCGGGQACYLQNGICQSPICVPGFEGDTCEIESRYSPTTFNSSVFYYNVALVLYTGVLLVSTIILSIDIYGFPSKEKEDWNQ